MHRNRWDPDIAQLKNALLRAAFTTGPKEIARLRHVVAELRQGNFSGALSVVGESAISVHYRLWGKSGEQLGTATLEDSFKRIATNHSILSDLDEILEWAATETRISGIPADLSFPCTFELHAQYSNVDIKAALGLATLESAGQTGVGVLHFRDVKSVRSAYHIPENRA